ncbi:MAG: cytochrome c peroxidase [Bacteroidota bacterium]
MKKFFFPTIVLLGMLSIAAGTIDLDNLFPYSSTPVPNYILKDNTPPFNIIDNQTATLGRVLFYDKNLSANRAISCSSCHQQEFAFSDTNAVSFGLTGGLTGRHSMRLANSRFGDEDRFFWDERAATLEDQVTQPIQDHVEMGFSGEMGDPDLDSLLRRLEGIDYYGRLFHLVYGDSTVTEDRIQRALAQFVRSIYSFDSKFDSGFAMTNNLAMPFPNFTQEENNGKRLYIQAVGQGGAGCQVCHRAPEFDIDPNSRNNGVVGVFGDSTAIDITITRSPNLRNLVNPSGVLNGALMHDASLTSLEAVIDHYDSVAVVAGNTNLDPRLNGGPGGPGMPPVPRVLNLAQAEKDALVAFLKTLTGRDIYTHEMWSDPFDEQGDLVLLPEEIATSIAVIDQEVKMYPNPATSFVSVDFEGLEQELSIYSINGQLMQKATIFSGQRVDVSSFQRGLYLLVLEGNGSKVSQKILLR